MIAVKGALTAGRRNGGWKGGYAASACLLVLHRPLHSSTSFPPWRLLPWVALLFALLSFFSLPLLPCSYVAVKMWLWAAAAAAAGLSVNHGRWQMLPTGGGGANSLSPQPLHLRTATPPPPYAPPKRGAIHSPTPVRLTMRCETRNGHCKTHNTVGRCTSATERYTATVHHRHLRAPQHNGLLRRPWWPPCGRSLLPSPRSTGNTVIVKKN